MKDGLRHRRRVALHYPGGLDEHGDGGEASEGDGEDEEHGCAVEGDAGEDQEWVRLARRGRRDFTNAVPVED